MAWWHQTDQFDWFSSYLRDRGLQRQLTTVPRDSSGVQLNVTMVDLDRFKNLNDTMGMRR
ncbi:hypothetical protein [Mycolicibacterium pyrenivorans]|uniref:hypothetical protein n=1 Tax=Mycolicibacterium pyrenivorans TaxID=187102 RepID=UPI0021F2C02B|nr:hypothetical protein [Mycolicibacterium pyrenivorans]MCV7152174.1 hypothetical protein [Mycolicibacterium pyrenivorans]